MPPVVLFLALLVSACASTADPTLRRDARGDVEQLARRAFYRMQRADRPCILEPGTEACARWREAADAFLALAADAPQDRYVQGQAVYSLVRAGAYDDALHAVENCRTAEWWCRVLRGHALAESGRLVEAEAAFDQALLMMPREERCEWTDLSLLVSGRTWSAYEGTSCTDRLQRLRRFWWLADPAWSLPGNDRKVEHFNRMVWAALHDDALTGESGDGLVDDGVGHSKGHHVEVVRHGMDYVRWDARWSRARDGPAYRVIPEEGALLTPFRARFEDWPIERNGLPETYVPRLGELGVLDAQVAFFERGGSVVVAAAVDAPDEFAPGGDGRPEAALFLGTGPDAPALTFRAAAVTGRRTFRVTAPRRRYVVGVEVASATGVGRFRSGHGLPHDPRAPLRLSDLLLYDPDGPTPPDSLGAAVPLMNGNHVWTRGDTIGVFLEVYGPDVAASIPVSVELEKKRGWLARLGGILGLGSGSPVNLRWSQPGPGGLFPVSFTLDLRDASEGDHTLRVSVGWPGMTPTTVERAVRIVAAGSQNPRPPRLPRPPRS